MSVTTPGEGRRVDLLPCPFCGGSAAIEPWHGGGPRKRHVGCDNEACPIRPGVTGCTAAVAVHRWNTRRGEEPQG